MALTKRRRGSSGTTFFLCFSFLCANNNREKRDREDNWTKPQAFLFFYLFYFVGSSFGFEERVQRTVCPPRTAHHHVRTTAASLAVYFTYYYTTAGTCPASPFRYVSSTKTTHARTTRISSSSFHKRKNSLEGRVVSGSNSLQFICGRNITVINSKLNHKISRILSHQRELIDLFESAKDREFIFSFVFVFVFILTTRNFAFDLLQTHHTGTPCTTSVADFTVATGTTCDLAPGAYSFNSVSISGTVNVLSNVTSSTFVSISATTTFTVAAGGVFTANGQGHPSPATSSAGKGPGGGIYSASTPGGGG